MYVSLLHFSCFPSQIQISDSFPPMQTIQAMPSSQSVSVGLETSRSKSRGPSQPLVLSERDIESDNDNPEDKDKDTLNSSSSLFAMDEDEGNPAVSVSQIEACGLRRKRIYAGGEYVPMQV